MCEPGTFRLRSWGAIYLIATFIVYLPVSLHAFVYISLFIYLFVCYSLCI
jgi:hypothetical protein